MFVEYNKLRIELNSIFRILSKRINTEGKNMYPISIYMYTLTRNYFTKINLLSRKTYKVEFYKGGILITIKTDNHYYTVECKYRKSNRCCFDIIEENFVCSKTGEILLTTKNNYYGKIKL